MASKQKNYGLLQWIGLGLFAVAMTLFTAVLGLERYTLTAGGIRVENEFQRTALVEAGERTGVIGQTYGDPFTFVSAYKTVFAAAKTSIDEQLEREGPPAGVEDESSVKLQDWQLKGQLFATVKASSEGPVGSNPWLWFGLTFGLGILGGLLFILPKFAERPGIHNDNIYHSPQERGLSLGWRGFFLGATIFGVLGYGIYYMGGQYVWPAVTLLVALVITGLVFFAQRSAARTPQRSASAPDYSAWLGVLTGVYFITFYVLLYWAPQYLTPWTLLVDPLSGLLSGGEASQWFLYGTLYTLVILVMGVRMLAKYRGNRYQQLRTGSVMFFQTAFAFLIPEALARLNQPYFDFKNIWPLDYTFFFDYRLNELMEAGGLGLFMLGWGIALSAIAVPTMTYFYGKRWYCSWVCGCGGLAETLGDPFRQLSDKSLRAWKYERFIVHGVLVFAVVMTALVLYHFFTGSNQIGFLNSDTVRQWYGFLIGAAFAGVVGTGFYPLMGNRVWCRFGCPLAAYLGLVQRFQSRFRITTNGGQCISCGNCSTYCEMGIDVRSYAQKGQDIVRSSCVGCGVCAAVCPRGVLRLENGEDTDGHRSDAKRAVHVPVESVGILS